ncbi:SHOCT domain-containing protein [Pseudoflavonifractor phocaeensis]|uniref:SHOCT domain-containing protein n=1 Tax=Pseudoflavonifractor phocaeensis TaxID=1870988 RepID=UPI00195EF45B|nr:SHOCT domain-containing protein [Pseudoflavonifractor phocaeensis]MBM6871417.1 SHOCT domain-containing protein [Pseudoflavonifractor phocaeensis]
MAQKEKKPAEKGVPLLYWGNLEKKKDLSPSREQLAMNGIFACVFFLIGLFLVAPNAVGYGALGILLTAVWLVASVAAAALYFYKAAHWQPAPVEEEAPEEDASLEERLKRLQSLYEQKLITEEEYQAKKQEILGQL